MAGRRVAGSVVTVREERPADAGAVRDLLQAAFATPAESRLVDELRTDPGYLPHLALVAVEDPAGDGTRVVVGHVMLTRLRMGAVGDPADGDEQADGDEALALAPLAVRPDRQRRGVGAALMEAALAAADAAGERLVVVVGDPDYYARFGFGPATDLGIRTPYGKGRQVMALALPGAATADLPRGLVAYPAPFAAF